MGCFCGSSLCGGTALCAIIATTAGGIIWAVKPHITVAKAVIDQQTDKAITAALSGLTAISKATAEKNPGFSKNVATIKTSLETFEANRQAKRAEKARQAEEAAAKKEAEITEGHHDCKCGHDHPCKKTPGGCHCDHP